MNFQKILERNEKLDEPLQPIENGLPVRENYNRSHLMEMAELNQYSLGRLIMNQIFIWYEKTKNIVMSANNAFSDIMNRAKPLSFKKVRASLKKEIDEKTHKEIEKIEMVNNPSLSNVAFADDVVAFCEVLTEKKIEDPLLKKLSEINQDPRSKKVDIPDFNRAKPLIKNWVISIFNRNP